MYGKSSKSKNQDDTINTLNCSSMDTWNTGNSLKKPANGWENGFSNYGNVPNVDPRMSIPAVPNTADAEQTMQYYHYMQYMQVMQMKAAAAYNTNPLGIGLNPLENLPSATAQSSYSLAAQLPGMPPGRPRPQAGGDPRAYPVVRNDGGRRDDGTGGSGGQRSSLTKSTLTYGEYKRQQEMLNNPNMKRNSPNNDGWDDPPRSSRQKQSNAQPVDDWDDEPTPAVAKKPMRKSYAAPVDDWDNAPTSSKHQTSNTPAVDDWDDEPTPAKMRKPHGDPWDEPPNYSKSNRSNAAPKDDWDDEPVAKKKPATDDWDDEPTPQSSRGVSHTRSAEPVDDWEDAQSAPSRAGGRDSYDRGSYRGRGGNRGGGGGSRASEKREGDWDCKDCGNTNFKWRKECHKCGTAGGNPDVPARNSRGGGFSRGRDRYNRGSSRDSSQSSDHHAAAKDDWDDEGSVKSNGSNNGRRGGFHAHKRRYDESNRGPPKRGHDARDSQPLGDDWDDEPIKSKASKIPPVPVDGWDDDVISTPKKRAPSKNDDWDDDKGPRSPSPERVRRRRQPSPSNDKYRRLEIELKLQRLENERLKLAFSGRRLGMTPSPPRSPSPEYEPVSRRRRYSPKEEKSMWESRRYRDPSVERSGSSHRRRAVEDDTKSNGSRSTSSSHKSKHSERVEVEVKSVKPSDTHMMIRGSVTSAALPPHELKKLPNYAHLYNLPAQDVQTVEDDIPPAPIINELKVRTKKDKKSRWSNQPAQKVEVVVLEEENWDDADIDEAESSKKSEEISTKLPGNDEDNWDDENVPEETKKEAIRTSDHDDIENNKKSSSETSEQKDSWDEDDKSPGLNDKSQDSGNQGPKKIDADFLGQQIAVQIEKIRHRQAILVQQHLNTQVILGTPAPASPPIIIEKLGATITDDLYDVSMPPPLIISADAIISNDVSPIESVILAQAIQITNKARGFESIALAPVIHQRVSVAAPLPEVIDLVDAPKVVVNSREGIEVLRPTYGLLRKTVPVKQMKLKSKLEENWDDDDEDSKPPQKVDFNILSNALKSDELLQVVSDEEYWEDDEDEIILKTKDDKIRNREKKSKTKKHEESSKKKSSYHDNWDDEESNQDYNQVDPDILARHMAAFAAGTTRNLSCKSSNVEDENWDDDPELEAASKKLIDPEILAKNVPLHNSMDSERISATTNKIVPLENTSESFRKEFGGSSKHHEKNKVIKALSSLPTSVASMPVSAAIAAYAAQKRKLNEQSYEYQPRREWVETRKHVDPYSYTIADYTVPVDYGRVPQSHPTHYGTQYEYNKYYKSLNAVPTKEKLSHVIEKPKVKQLKGELPVNKTKTVEQVQKKKKLELNAEDLSDGEIVDSEEDFGSVSDINSANEDDDVIEIPVKVDLVDLTEEEMAAAIKEESVTANIKEECVFNPPIPTEDIEIPKPPEIEDSPESPVNMEVNEDPEELHENLNDSPASPENMDVTEESPESTVETIQMLHESPASPVNSETATEDVIASEETPKENEIEDSPESPVKMEFNESPASPVNTPENEIEDSPASPVNNEPETSENVTEDNEANSSEVRDEIEVDKLPALSDKEDIESLKGMNTDTSPDSHVNEYSEECPRSLEEDSPSSPGTNVCNSSHNEVAPVEAHDEKHPEQVKVLSELIAAPLNSEEPSTIDPTEIPIVENDKKDETPLKDTQESEDDNQEVANHASESDSEMDDEDILLDDDELEAAALFLSNETVNVPEDTTTASSNESTVKDPLQKGTVVLNGSLIENDFRFNPYILIKKEKFTDLPRTVVKVSVPTDPDSDIEEVPVTETPASNRRSNRIRQSTRK